MQLQSQPLLQHCKDSSLAVRVPNFFCQRLSETKQPLTLSKTPAVRFSESAASEVTSLNADEESQK